MALVTWGRKQSFPVSFYTGQLTNGIQILNTQNARGVLIKLYVPATFTLPTTTIANSGQAVIGMTNTAGIQKGMLVADPSNTNIPLGTHVLSLVANVSITLSANITPGNVASGTVLTFNQATGTSIAVSAYTSTDRVQPIFDTTGITAPGIVVNQSPGIINVLHFNYFPTAPAGVVLANGHTNAIPFLVGPTNLSGVTNAVNPALTCPVIYSPGLQCMFTLSAGCYVTFDAFVIYDDAGARPAPDSSVASVLN